MKVLRKTWGQQSDGQRSIVVLTAEIQTIKDSNIQISVSVSRNIKNKVTSNASGVTCKYHRNDPKHIWRQVREERSPTILIKFNNTYNWCNYNKILVTHTNAKCKGQNNVSPRQPSPRIPAASTIPQHLVADVTPSPVSYATTFEVAIATIREKKVHLHEDQWNV